jgi:hypothetical protein
MKYSGSDFKMTSQANHLAKLLNLLTETQRQSHHMQRLYKRRKTDSNGYITSNWSVLRQNSVLDGNKKEENTSKEEDIISEIVYDGGLI